jgi:hypothetical protein
VLPHVGPLRCAAFAPHFFPALLPSRMASVAARLLVSFFLLASAASAQVSERVRVHSLEGKATTLEKWRVLADGSLEGAPVGEAGFGQAMQAEGKKGFWRLPVADLWRLEVLTARKSAAETPLALNEGFVQLRSGAVLPAEFLGGQGRQWKLRIGFGNQKSEGEVPSQLLQALRLEKAPEVDDGSFADALKSPSETSDFLFYWDKERKKLRRLSAQIGGFEDGAFIAERGSRKLRIPQDRVHGIVFSSLGGVELGDAKRPGRVLIELVTGMELTGRIGEAKSVGHLGLRLFDAISVELPFDQVRRIEWVTPRLHYVSTLSHQLVEQVAPLEAKPLLRFDRGLGAVLSLGRERYERGMLVSPGIKIDFELPTAEEGRPWRLIGRLGMPSAPFGGAIVRLFADDKAIGEELKLSADGAVIELGLDLGKAKKLRVEVLPREDLDAGGRVIFGELRILDPS